MDDSPVKPKSYIRLMVLVALLGVVSAVVTFAFMELVHITSGVIWDQAPYAIGMDPRLFTFLICSLGGLGVGLLVKLFGDHNAIFFELMREFGKTGRFNYRHAPGIVLTAFISLISGAALGPEAPLADACGGIGTWTAEKLKLDERETRTLGFGGLGSMLAAFITNPFGGALLSLESSQGGMRGMQTYLWGLFPSLLAGAVATVVFVGLSGSFFSQLYSFPTYIPRLEDLLIAVPLALIGGLAGLLFTLMFKALRRLMQPMNNHLVLRGLIGGIGMGIIGALLPLTLFSGEEQTVELVKEASTIGFGMLIVLAASKLFATTLLLVTGWKGGYIFPIMFAGIALGMACTLLFPDVPTAVTVAAVLAGVVVVVLRAPLFAVLFTLALVDSQTAPVVAVSVLVGSLMTAYLVRWEARQESAKIEPAPQPSAN